MTAAAARRADVRARIVDIAARLLRERGPEAVTTRGVAEQAGVQAPMIYRLFGDKDGLLDAVAEHVMAGYATAKAEDAEASAADPVDDLRTAWRTQVDFGLGNPSLFRLLSDPDRVRRSAAARAGRQVLRARVRRIAAAGRLRVSEQRAVGLIEAGTIGAIQAMLATPPEHRDPGLSGGMCDAVLRHLLAEPPESAPGDVATAITLRAVAPRLDALSRAERQVLVEWLDRVIDDDPAAD